MSTVAERAREVVDELSLFDDWTDRYAHLVDGARSLPPMDAAHRTDENRVRGCQSLVWLYVEPDGDRVRLHADAEATIVKGLVALLVRVYDGQPAAEVAAADVGFLEEAGLSEHLSPNRANGFAAMVARMKAEASALTP